MTELRVRRIHPDAQMPAGAYPGDAGLDLASVEDVVLGPGERRTVATGLAVAIPPGHGGFVQPRSGLAARHGITVVNSPGLIDSGYRGELKVVLLNTDAAEPFHVRPGDRIAQLVVLALPQVEVIEASEPAAVGAGRARLRVIDGEIRGVSPPRIRVGALLRHGDAVLLLRQEKLGRSYWLLPGGGVEEGESLHVALARELSEECGLEGVTLEGPIAIVESIAPPSLRPRKHVVHVIFYADVSGRSLEDVASADGTIHGHRLMTPGELAAVDLRPPIHRFLERWRPGDPFVHLGELWVR